MLVAVIEKIMTSHRESIKIAAVLTLYGPCKVKFIRETTGLTDKAGRILIDNHYAGLKGNSGVYSLDEKL